MCSRMVRCGSCCEVQAFLHAGQPKLYFVSAFVLCCVVLCWKSVIELDTSVGTRQVGGIRFMVVSDRFAMIAEEIDT